MSFLNLSSLVFCFKTTLHPLGLRKMLQHYCAVKLQKFHLTSISRWVGSRENLPSGWTVSWSLCLWLTLVPFSPWRPSGPLVPAGPWEIKHVMHQQKQDVKCFSNLKFHKSSICADISLIVNKGQYFNTGEKTTVCLQDCCTEAGFMLHVPLTHVHWFTTQTMF